MDYLQLSLKNYLSEVNSDKSMPGGGSVAAYVSSLGIGLARMLGLLSIGKEKFKEIDLAEQENFLITLELLENNLELLIDYVNKDCECFLEIMDAYKIEKTNPNRQSIIQDKTFQAALLPLRAAEIGYNSLNLCLRLVKYGNRMVLSDLLSALYLIDAGVKCSLINVKVNANLLDDQAQKNRFYAAYDQLKIDTHALMEENIKNVENIVYGGQ